MVTAANRKFSVMVIFYFCNHNIAAITKIPSAVKLFLNKRAEIETLLVAVAINFVEERYNAKIASNYQQKI